MVLQRNYRQEKKKTNAILLVIHEKALATLAMVGAKRVLTTSVF
jgi:hypothetical protein